MRYTIRRIRLGSAARLGCALGWLIALVPAMCLAALAVRVLRQIARALERVEPITLTVLGQELARIDILVALGLQSTAQTVDRLVTTLPATFIGLTLLLILAGALIFVAVALLASVGYNLLARLGWGLDVELSQDEED